MNKVLSALATLPKETVDLPKHLIAAKALANSKHASPRALAKHALACARQLRLLNTEAANAPPEAKPTLKASITKHKAVIAMLVTRISTGGIANGRQAT